MERRTVLVALAGLTPQVVTETLYGMWRSGVVPSEIHVLTTLPGRVKVLEGLLDARRGAFYRFCADYGVDHRAIRFDADTVHVFHGRGGEPLEDIRTASDNAAVADQIVDLVRRLASDGGVRIHASLAGGRKTMTFYLGYALSLFGRPGDRLTHVLVSPDFENHPEFYYPPRSPVELRTDAGKRVSTAEARVDLVEIPFVRLGELVPARVLTGEGFAEVVARAEQELLARCEPLRLEVAPAQQELRHGPAVCRLSPQGFAVYLHLVLATGREGGFLSFPDLIGEDLVEAVWREDARRIGLSGPEARACYEAVERLAEAKKGYENFVALVSKINRAIRAAFPPRVADAAEVRRRGRRPVGYGVEIGPDQLRAVTE